jgi:opacity protein-like surface antigen
MTRVWLAVIAAIALVPGAAAAQEVAGAERIEIGSAIFGGGMLFVASDTASQPVSHSYTLGLAMTANVNRWVGIEGDIGAALGRQEAHALYGVVPTNSNQDTPNVLMYGGNVLFNPWASDRPIVPYVSAGLGALTTFTRPDGSAFGLAGNRTFLTGSVGGGVRYFPIRHWGVRADYRFLGIRQGNAAAPAGDRVVRSAHRVYGALVLTF